MGLDMYLDVSRYVGTYGEDEIHRDLMEFVNSRMVSSPVPERTDGLRSCTVSVAALYWRKANAIHNWFVEHVQDGIDECQTTEVDEESLQQLVDVCSDVLGELNQYFEEAHSNDEWNVVEVPADVVERVEEMLTPRSGFFFGSTDIDLRYYRQVKYTHDRLTELLRWLRKELEGKRYWDVTYRSSW